MLAGILGGTRIGPLEFAILYALCLAGCVAAWRLYARRARRTT